MISFCCVHILEIVLCYGGGGYSMTLHEKLTLVTGVDRLW
jgi:hypothetical protein